MEELLTRYDLSEILIFIVILAIAAKGVVTYLDWVKDKISQNYKKKSKEEKGRVSIEQQISQILTNQEEMTKQLQDMSSTIEILKGSDKEDIKAFITEKHHYFCYQKGYIDDYSLDVLERRFKYYKEEEGNSFAEDLMEDIRRLPKVSTLSNDNEK